MSSDIANGLGKLHPRFLTSLRATLHSLTEWLGEALLGACVVGSSVCGDWDEGSDLDLIFITREDISYPIIAELEQKLREQGEIRVQLINMHPEFLREQHLENRSTMAHSIRRGLVVLDREGLFDPFMRLTDADLPDRKWIKGYFIHFIYVYYSGLHWVEQKKEFHKELDSEFVPDYPNDLCRAIVNFSILYLELNGIIPTSKRQIISGLKRMDMPAAIVKDARDSMYIRREDRQINEEEVARFTFTAWALKKRLQKLLGISDNELEEHDVRKIFLRKRIS